VVDDLRPELNEAFGKTYMQTPNIDTLSRSSLVFRRAFVQQAICGASRSSFLTGRRVETTRVYDLHSYWRDVSGDFVSIGQQFAEKGFATRGFGKIAHPVCGGAQHDSPGECDPKAWSLPYFHSPEEGHWTCSTRSAQRGYCSAAIDSYYTVSPAEEAQHPMPDAQIAQEAVDQLHTFATARDSGGSQQPFFMGVGFHKPHLPFVVPQRHVHKYPLSSIQVAPNNYAPVNMPLAAWSNNGELMSYPDIVALHLPEQHLPGWQCYGTQPCQMGPNGTFPDQKARELRQHYFAAVSFADEQVGSVLTALDTNGYSQNTIVMFFGDHGWQLGEHGEWCKHTQFDIATNTPLILRVPGVTDAPGFRQHVSDGYVELVDVMPTLADYAGITVPTTCPVRPGCPEFGCSSDSNLIRHCTEGQSLRTIVDRCAAGANCDTAKAASFSVYPHYGRNNQWHAATGYSMTTKYQVRPSWVMLVRAWVALLTNVHAHTTGGGVPLHRMGEHRPGS
jgi:iduronate 2-sulfatase